jgi:homogentisate 1,2-dioxygenase
LLATWSILKFWGEEHPVLILQHSSNLQFQTSQHTDIFATAANNISNSGITAVHHHPSKASQYSSAAAVAHAAFHNAKMALDPHEILAQKLHLHKKKFKSLQLRKPAATTRFPELDEPT